MRKKKQKFTLEFPESKLREMSQDLMFMDKITRNILLKDLTIAIADEIMDECGELSEYVNYSELCKYGAASDITCSLSDCLEQIVYDSFQDMYHLNEEQLEEMKKFYQEGIDLNLVTKKTEGKFILGREMLSAEEMKEVRISIEDERKESMRQGRKDTNEFKENLKVEGMTQPYIEQEEERSIPRQEQKEM